MLTTNNGLFNKLSYEPGSGELSVSKTTKNKNCTRTNTLEQSVAKPLGSGCTGVGGGGQGVEGGGLKHKALLLLTNLHSDSCVYFLYIVMYFYSCIG